LYDQPTKLSASTASINGMNYAEISGVTSFSGGSGAIALSPDPSLPVELVSFEGWNTPLGNQLQWITFSETNNAHFVIQHSTDPLLGFEDLGQVNGAGTTTSSKSYEFLHDNPMLGDNYYRLKQVDINGAFGYSNVIVLKVEGSINRSVFYPNPTLDILNYQFTNKENQQLHITISNVLGQTISSRYLSAQEGLNSYQLNLSSFSSGVYNVHVYREDGLLIATQKITKKPLNGTYCLKRLIYRPFSSIHL
jgi:hypothetical protein